MKIINLSNSDLTEITFDEAANVNGGSGYSYVSYSKLYDDYFDFSTVLSNFWKNKPKIDAPIGSYSGFKDYYKIDVAAVDSSATVSTSSSTDTAIFP
ncbi:MAG: hypothetical protein AAGE84_13790 [Cyanobacteria bacterium P01_G01_bin.39]